MLWRPYSQAIPIPQAENRHKSTMKSGFFTEVCGGADTTVGVPNIALRPIPSMTV
jgi:hypothetical protein